MQEHVTDPNHFSDEDWLRFLDHAHDPEVGENMRRHARACARCASLLESLMAVRTGLEAGAAEFRAAVARSAPDVDILLDRCLAQIRSASRSRWSAAEATLLLRVLLEPICGRGTAGATIDLARRRSIAAAQNQCSGAQLTSGNWSLFISNLSDAMSSICGAAAGTLVRRAGFSIALQES